MSQARHEIVLTTDDDCTVDDSWVGAAWEHMKADTTAIVTGRVLAVGERSSVPSRIDEATSHDYTGELQYGALYGANMSCNRSLVLDFGGFDPRFEAAEDNDLCYRWLRAGRPLRYEPDLVVWHHGWRSPGEMAKVYFVYGRGQGMFYAKHLQAGDLRVVRFLVRDLYRGISEDRHERAVLSASPGSFKFSRSNDALRVARAGACGTRGSSRGRGAQAGSKRSGGGGWRASVGSRAYRPCP